MKVRKERIADFKKKYLISKQEELFLGGEKPASLLWDQCNGYYIFSHNRKIEFFSRDWKPIKCLYEQIDFEQTPYLIKRDKYIISIPSTGNNIFRKLSLENEEIIVQKKIDNVVIGNIYSFSNDHFIASCYEEDSLKPYVILFSDKFEIIEQYYFSNIVDVSRGNVIPLGIKSDGVLVLASNIDQYKQKVVFFSLEKKDVIKEIYLTNVLSRKIWGILPFRGGVFIAGDEFLSYLDKNDNIVFLYNISKHCLSILSIIYVDHKVYLYAILPWENKIIRWQIS